jgi:hypothetical protein
LGHLDGARSRRGHLNTVHLGLFAAVVWRVLEGHVTRERAKLDYSDVRRVGMYQTAASRGQDYVSIFMDLDHEHRVLFATGGRDADTVAAFAEDLRTHGGNPDVVRRAEARTAPELCTRPADPLGVAEEPRVREMMTSSRAEPDGLTSDGVVVGWHDVGHGESWAQARVHFVRT